MYKPRNGKNIECIECKKQFYVPLYRVEKTKYCSRECHTKNSIQRIKKNCEFCKKEYEVIPYRKNLAKYCSAQCYTQSNIKPPKKFICLHCGVEFIDEKRFRKRKFCSNKCKGKIHHKNWQPCYSSIRKRMEIRGMINKCQICGYNEVTEILGVHHIDENRKNNSLKNLMILCPNCHSVQHRRHIVH